jgi:hypothetical protein
VALTRVQSQSASANSTTPSVTLGSAPGLKRLLVVAFMANDNAGGLSISSVSPGFTQVPIDGDISNPNELREWVYYKIAGPGESATISATIDDSRHWVAIAAEYNDSDGGTWGLDQSAQDIGSGSAADSGTTATTTQAIEVWVAFIANQDNDTQSAPTNGFTQRENNTHGSGSDGIRGAFYDKIVAAPGAAGTAVTVGASRPWTGGVYTFYSLTTVAPIRRRLRTLDSRLSRQRRGPYSELRRPTVELIVPYPANTVAPVTSGTPVVGQTLSVTNGSWSGSPSSFTYQWFRDTQGVGPYTAIPGATANTYLLVDADDICHIRCEVTAYNVRGPSSPAASNVLGPVTEPAPVNTVPPVVTGSPLVGSALTTDTGVWLHMGGTSASFTYQWQWSANGVTDWTNVVVNGNFSFYWPTATDVGRYLRVVVTATNSGGSSSATSLVLGPVSTQGTVMVTETLGCGVYEAVVLTRGGGGLVAILPWTDISWSRVLDDTSQATVSGATGQDERCCAAIAAIRPWRHEIGILRNNELIWVGPIVQVQTPPGQFQIDARDLSAWWDHRLIHQTQDFVQTDLATIFQALFDDAMDPDPSPGILLATTFSGVKGSKRVLQNQHQLAGPVLRDLTNTGIDWTAVGRTILAGGLVVPTSPIGTFVDSHFTVPPTPIFSGEQQSNAPTVRGAGGGTSGDRVFATSTNFPAVAADGLLESVESVSSITDFNSAQQAADTQLALRKAVAQVENCQLAPDAPYPLSLLVPGALCHIDLTESCIPVFGSFRLKSVSGAVGASQDDSVTLVFQPEGTTRAEGAPAP